MVDFQLRREAIKHWFQFDTQSIAEFRNRNVDADHECRIDNLRFRPMLVEPVPQLFRHTVGIFTDLYGEIEQRDYDVYSERVRFSKSALLAQMLRLWLTGALRSRRLRLRPRRRAAE